MQFVKSKNQYIDAILFDSDKYIDDLQMFLIEKCACDVQKLGEITKEYYPDGVDSPVLEGMSLPVAVVASLYVCGKKREIISVPKGYYLTWNGRAIKVVERWDFEKEWAKVDSNGSQYKFEEQYEED